MQTLELMLLTVFGAALLAGLSIGLYLVLPNFVLECGERHGRFGGLGMRGRLFNRPAGNAPAKQNEALRGQAA